MKQIKKNSTLFNSFPDSILFKMIDEPLLYHAHDWVISTDTYEKREPLKNFFNILATDEHDGTEFVVAVEAKDYPVSGVMFHPETQNRHIVGQCDSSMFGKVNNLTTDAINFYFSQHINERGKKNLETSNNRFKDPEFGMRMEWLNANVGFTLGGESSNLVSFGFD